jgi:hypothetical protein
MRTILLIILILLLLGAVPKWPGELEILSKWRTRIGVTDRSDIGFNRPFVVEARAKSDSTCHNFVSPSRFIEDFPGRGNRWLTTSIQDTSLNRITTYSTRLLIRE